MNNPAVEILLTDADVLIDYRDSDLTVLKLVSEHIGAVRVLRQVLDEAPGISDRRCAQLGIEIVQLETELLIEANDLPRSLSIADRFCIVACERNRWTLVSNDRAMRAVSKQRGIRLRWGLGLMVDLVHAGVLTETRDQGCDDDPGREPDSHHRRSSRPIPSAAEETLALM
jgi:PIN domain nuclease of toxin-antitoxin system